MNCSRLYMVCITLRVLTAIYDWRIVFQKAGLLNIRSHDNALCFADMHMFATTTPLRLLSARPSRRGRACKVPLPHLCQQEISTSMCSMRYAVRTRLEDVSTSHV